MEKFLTISQLVTAAIMVGLILMQQRGASLGAAFGGESSVYRSRRGVEKWLFYATIIVAVLFLGLTISLLLV